MYVAMNTWLELSISYSIAWIGMIPFLVKDAVLSVIAAMFMVNITKRLPLLWQRA
jgi:biotin transport system substrate-specific component